MSVWETPVDQIDLFGAIQAPSKDASRRADEGWLHTSSAFENARQAAVIRFEN